MAHISFQFMLMMLIHWEEAHVLWQKNTEALVVASKENGLEVIANKTKFMVMSRDRIVGRSHNIKIDNSYLTSVDKFK
jgi:hypothetical protein